VGVAACGVERTSGAAVAQEVADQQQRGDRTPAQQRQPQHGGSRQAEKITAHLVRVDPAAVGEQKNNAAVDAHGAKGYHNRRDAHFPHQQAVNDAHYQPESGGQQQ